MNEIRVLKGKDIPDLLQEINDPPEKLYIRGVLPPSSFIPLAVVGPRKYTTYGESVCNTLIEGLRGYPVSIISGLALGIDSIAHRAALRVGLPTIAVPGSGIDDSVIYPSSHVHLAHEILKKGGALLSEFEPDFKATIWGFPKRNRIMAGLSRAVLIIEAEKKSGTLITARLAMEYNRDVLTVPGSIFSKNSEGPHYLIRNGATPVANAEDILEILNIKDEEKNDSFSMPEDCSDGERKVLLALNEPCSKDELIDRLDMSMQEFNMLISLMEIKGLIKETLGEIRRN